MLSRPQDEFGLGLDVGDQVARLAIHQLIGRAEIEVEALVVEDLGLVPVERRGPLQGAEPGQVLL